ncbi:MAG: hypothetical protein HOI80_02805 [Alphaproteobacteria bacterium]|nr:hypothetical protein [Alphaproteobacteria bacterium]
MKRTSLPLVMPSVRKDTREILKKEARQVHEFNPLDHLEDHLRLLEHRFNRASSNELIIEMKGRWAEYNVFMIWDHETAMIYTACGLEFGMDEGTHGNLCKLLTLIHNNMWIGHFDLCEEKKIIIFRHSFPLRDVETVTFGQFSDLINLTLQECDRFYPAFVLLVEEGKCPEDAMESVMLETAGVA